MSKRLPVYLLIDSSGSMHGEPIQAVNVGIRSMLAALRKDHYARQSVYLSLITFDREVKELLPLTQLLQAQINDIQLPRSGATHLGEGLEFLMTRVERDFQPTTETKEGDFRPMLFIMTDGSPSDSWLFKEMVPKVKAFNFAAVVACAAGPKAKTEALKQLTDQVVILETMDGAGFSQLFKWISDSIAAGSGSTQTEKNQESSKSGSSSNLPPPPDEIQIVI